MSLGLALLIAPIVLLTAALIPALLVQLALGYWYRPAERIALEEAWAVRFESQVGERAQTYPG